MGRRNGRCDYCHDFMTDHKKCAKKLKSTKCCCGKVVNCQYCNTFFGDHKDCAKKNGTRRCCCNKLIPCRKCRDGVGLFKCHQCEDLKKNDGRCCYGHKHDKCRHCRTFGGDHRKCTKKAEKGRYCCCGKDLKDTDMPPPSYWGW